MVYRVLCIPGGYISGFLKHQQYPHIPVRHQTMVMKWKRLDDFFPHDNTHKDGGKQRRFEPFVFGGVVY